MLVRCKPGPMFRDFPAFLTHFRLQVQDGEPIGALLAALRFGDLLGATLLLLGQKASCDLAARRPPFSPLYPGGPRAEGSRSRPGGMG